MQTAMTKPQSMTEGGVTLSSFTTRAAPADERATRPSAGRDEEINEAREPNAPDPQPHPRHNSFRWEPRGDPGLAQLPSTNEERCRFPSVAYQTTRVAQSYYLRGSNRRLSSDPVPRPPDRGAEKPYRASPAAVEGYRHRERPPGGIPCRQRCERPRRGRRQDLRLVAQRFRSPAASWRDRRHLKSGKLWQVRQSIWSEQDPKYLQSDIYKVRRRLRQAD